MPPLRVVLDTNVLVSALVLRSGSLTWLPRSWYAQELTPLTSNITFSELVETFTSPKFGLTLAETNGLLSDYIPWCELCELMEVAEPPVVPECRDPNDRPFLELALLSNADALVTGDRDLLVLEPVFSIPIITPNTLRRRLAELR